MGRFVWLWSTKLVRWGAMSLGGPLGRGFSNKAGILGLKLVDLAYHLIHPARREECTCFRV